MIILSLPDSMAELFHLFNLRNNPQVQASLATTIATAVAQAYSHQIGPIRQPNTLPSLEPRVWNKNRAKYQGGVCGDCFEPIEQGEIVYLTEGTRARHLRCPPQPPDIIR